MNKINRFMQGLYRGCFRHQINIIGRSCSSANKLNDETEKLSYSKRVFSGIQPTGSLHIGNYLGAVKQWIDFQNAGQDIMVSIVDLHSITVPQKPEVLRKNILEMTASLLACGIDSDKIILFLQSNISKHAELCWILATIATMARLSRLPQYKEKSENYDDIPLGLFLYPVLQAADILLYKSTHVPVGEDQVQHLQMAQQLVKTFNHRFGKTFPHPVALVGENSCGRVKSLRDPLKKMSKSDTDPKSRILLTDSSESIRLKIKKSVTDFIPEVTYDPESRPGVSNLINIHCLVSDKIPEEVCEEVEGVNTGRYKNIVSDAVCEHIKPIREKLEYYLKNPDYLCEVLEKGSVKANERASITIKEVYEKIGLGIPDIGQELVLNQSKIKTSVN